MKARKLSRMASSRAKHLRIGKAQFRVSDWMTPSPTLVAPTATLRAAIELMRQGDFRRLPVVEAGRLVGIITDRDLRVASGLPRIPHEPLEGHLLLDHVTVGEVMTRELFTVSPDTGLQDAARLMLEQKIGGLPVVEGDGLVGIITESDLLRCFIQLLDRESSVEMSSREFKETS